jgi:rod shape-determining protein MreC
MIGRVSSIVKDPSSNFLTLNIKSATNFYNIEYVYLIQNKRMEAQADIEQKGEGNE